MSIYDTLNKEQKEAVLHTEGPLLLLAAYLVIQWELWRNIWYKIRL